MSDKRPFHVRLRPETVEAARELASRLNFEYAKNPATGRFLEFAIYIMGESLAGRYLWFDIEKQSFVDPAIVAQEFQNSNPNN
jgi:hypothetical protein